MFCFNLLKKNLLHFIWVNEFKFHSRVGDLLEVKLECQEEELTELQFYEIQHPHNSSVSLVQNSVYNNIHKNLTNYACLFADIIYCSKFGVYKCSGVFERSISCSSSYILINIVK